MKHRIISAENEIIWIHDRGFPVRDEAGRLTLICGLASNVTASKTKEMICETNVPDFRRTFENAGVGIAMIDNGGVVSNSNPALQRMQGYSDEELRRVPIQSLIHPAEDDGDLAANPSGRLKKSDFRHLRKQLKGEAGDVLMVDMTLISICDASGNSNYTIGLVERNAESDSGKA